MQLNRLLRILVADDAKSDRRRDLDAKLFPQLPSQTIFQSLARLTLAAGKLPESSQVGVWFASCDQIPAILHNEAGGDLGDAGLATGDR